VSALSGSELEDKQIETIGVKDPVLKRGIAVCHMLHPSKSGALIGTAVDQTGFAATSAKMISETSIKLAGGETVEYLKRFEFNHHSMTQSVIIRHGSETVVYAKGSPEAISKLCVESSIPANFEEKAQNFARNGIYQLAYGTASFTSSKAIHDVTREDIEKNLSFAGVINFENKLRKETPAVIQELSEGSVESAIVTVSLFYSIVSSHILITCF
jgi:magnesium-transporting ATPase (P-type)